MPTTRRQLLTAIAFGGLATRSAGQCEDWIDVPLKHEAGERRLRVRRFLSGGTPRGQLLFSHGMGAQPSAYSPFLQALSAAGFTVYAPLHIDSRQNPLHASTPMQATLGERIKELQATLAWLRGQHQPLTLGLVGHSYGSLLCWALVGGVRELGLPPAPEVQAVLAFSSAGLLPFQRRDGSYQALTVPTLTVTGTQDLVPGFVTNWRDHLQAFEQSPKPAWAVVIENGGHEAIADTAQLNALMPLALDFLAAHLLDQRAALERLGTAGALPLPSSYTLLRRNLRRAQGS